MVMFTNMAILHLAKIKLLIFLCFSLIVSLFSVFLYDLDLFLEPAHDGLKIIDISSLENVLCGDRFYTSDNPLKAGADVIGQNTSESDVF